MTRYEYKCIAAPRRARPFKGVRSHEDQFAAVLSEIMNEMAASEWEYLRAESLPCEEKSGLTRRVESYQSMLVFRRPLVADRTFFEVPATHRIELHEVPEDRTEQERSPAAGGGGGNVTSFPSEMAETDEPASETGVLSILRSRKARLTLRETEDETEESMRLAGE